MNNRKVNNVLAAAVANYIKSLENTIKEQKTECYKETEKLHHQVRELTITINQKNKMIDNLITESHKSQDADVIVGAITGNVSRKYWEDIAKSFKNNMPVLVPDNAKIPIQKELAELIERSLEYKWGR